VVDFHGEALMIDMTNTRSLTDFQQNTKAHLQRLRKSGKPEVLTVNGHAELVVQSATSYQKLVKDLELLETLKGIRRALDQARVGQGKPMREFLQELLTINANSSALFT
jgi:PHD/YefM family antitoxin component YafN of YafNO toxin-antitoxin module